MGVIAAISIVSKGTTFIVKRDGICIRHKCCKSVFTAVENKISCCLPVRKVINFWQIRTSSVVIYDNAIERVGNLVCRVEFGTTTIHRVNQQHFCHVLVIPCVILRETNFRTSGKRCRSVIADRIIGSGHIHTRQWTVNPHTCRIHNRVQNIDYGSNPSAIAAATVFPKTHRKRRILEQWGRIVGKRGRTILGNQIGRIHRRTSIHINCIPTLCVHVGESQQHLTLHCLEGVYQCLTCVGVAVCRPSFIIEQNTVAGQQNGGLVVIGPVEQHRGSTNLLTFRNDSMPPTCV